MKKKVVLLLAATMIVTSLSGCGMTKKESEAMITDISNADMLKTADEKSLINADEAVKAFSDALTKVKEEKNVTIDTTTTTNLGEGDKAENAVNTSKLKKNITDDKIVSPEKNESFLPSSPTARSTSDSTDFPIFIVYIPRQNFVTAVPATIRTISILTFISDGCKIPSIDSFNILIPAYKIRIPTTMPVRYSILPYPNGCFSSGCFPESFVPTYVRNEDPASVALLIPSDTIAIDDASVPITIFTAAISKLTKIPIKDVLIIRS